MTDSNSSNRKSLEEQLKRHATEEVQLNIKGLERKTLYPRDKKQQHDARTVYVDPEDSDAVKSLLNEQWDEDPPTRPDLRSLISTLLAPPPELGEDD